MKTLWLDLDGTLLDSHPLGLRVNFVRGFVRAMREQGYPRARSAWALRCAIAALQAEGSALRNDLRAGGVFGRILGLPPEAGTSLLRETSLRVFPGLERYFFPIEGARDFVEWAYSRFDLVLATNPVWPLSIVELRLRWAGIDPGRFRWITHVQNMRSCKPHLDYYRAILAADGADPATCTLIGNSERKDGPARRLGVRVLLVQGKRPFARIQRELFEDVATGLC